MADEDDMIEHANILRGKVRDLRSYEDRNTEPSDSGAFMRVDAGCDEGELVEDAELAEPSLRRHNRPHSFTQESVPGERLPVRDAGRTPELQALFAHLREQGQDLKQVLQVTDIVGAHVQGLLKVRKADRLHGREVAMLLLWMSSTVMAVFAASLLGTFVGAFLVAWRLIPVMLELAQKLP